MTPGLICVGSDPYGYGKFRATGIDSSVIVDHSGFSV